MEEKLENLCKTCNTVYPRSEFYGRYRSICKKCFNKRSSERNCTKVFCEFCNKSIVMSYVKKHQNSYFHKYLQELKSKA